MKISTSESGVVRACLEYLHARGIFSWRQNQVAVHGRRFVGLKGVSDILGMVPAKWNPTGGPVCGYKDLGVTSVDWWHGAVPAAGCLLAIECKRSGGRLSAEQKQFGREVLLRGGLYIVATGIKDLEDAGL